MGDLHAVPVVELGGPLADGQRGERMPLLGVLLPLASPMAGAVSIGRGSPGGGARGAGAQRGWLGARTRRVCWRGLVHLHQLLGRFVQLRGEEEGDGRRGEDKRREEEVQMFYLGPLWFTSIRLPTCSFQSQQQKKSSLAAAVPASFALHTQRTTQPKDGWSFLSSPFILGIETYFFPHIRTEEGLMVLQEGFSF